MSETRDNQGRVFRVWCVADLINELMRLPDPGQPVYMYTPEWVDAYALGGLSVYGDKIVLNTGTLPDAPAPEPIGDV